MQAQHQSSNHRSAIDNPAGALHAIKHRGKDIKRETPSLSHMDALHQAAREWGYANYDQAEAELSRLAAEKRDAELRERVMALEVLEHGFPDGWGYDHFNFLVWSPDQISEDTWAHVYGSIPGVTEAEKEKVRQMVTSQLPCALFTVTRQGKREFFYGNDPDLPAEEEILHAAFAGRPLDISRFSEKGIEARLQEAARQVADLYAADLARNPKRARSVFVEVDPNEHCAGIFPCDLTVHISDEYEFDSAYTTVEADLKVPPEEAHRHARRLAKLLRNRDIPVVFSEAEWAQAWGRPARAYDSWTLRQFNERLMATTVDPIWVKTSSFDDNDLLTFEADVVFRAPNLSDTPIRFVLRFRKDEALYVQSASLIVSPAIEGVEAGELHREHELPIEQALGLLPEFRGVLEVIKTTQSIRPFNPALLFEQMEAQSKNK